MIFRRVARIVDPMLDQDDDRGTVPGPDFAPGVNCAGAQNNSSERNVTESPIHADRAQFWLRNCVLSEL